MLSRKQLLDLLDGKPIYRSPDFIGQYLLIIKAVEAMRTTPEISYYDFATQVGLTEFNFQLGRTGWYMQVAREIIKRQEELEPGDVA